MSRDVRAAARAFSRKGPNRVWEIQTQDEIAFGPAPSGTELDRMIDESLTVRERIGWEEVRRLRGRVISAMERIDRATTIEQAQHICVDLALFMKEAENEWTGVGGGHKAPPRGAPAPGETGTALSPNPTRE